MSYEFVRQLCNNWAYYPINLCQRLQLEWDRRKLLRLIKESLEKKYSERYGGKAITAKGLISIIKIIFNSKS